MRVKQIVFLAGGKGTRLKELTKEMPKPLLAVRGKPFLDYHLESARRFGFERAVILTGHHGNKIADRYADAKSEFGIKVTCIRETEPLGTAGPLKYARSALDDIFFLLNADSIFDFDLLDLAALYTPDTWVGRIAARQVPDASEHGVMVVDPATAQVTHFRERGDNSSAVINGGVYLLRRTICDYITTTPSSLEQDVFPRLAKEGKLYAKLYQGYFIDIGTPTTFERAQKEL